MAVADILTTDVDAWEKAQRAAGYAESSIAGRRKVLHQILADAVADTLRESNPAFRRRGRGRRSSRVRGVFSVNPGWPNPWIGDEAARAADRRELPAATTSPSRRGEIAGRYGAACVLIARTPGDDAIDGYRALGDGLFCR